MATILQTILNGLAVPFQGRFESNPSDTGLTPHSVLEIAGTGVGVNTANPLPVSDSQSAAFQGAVALTLGVAATAGRSLGVLCTTAGNVNVQFPDGSTLIVPVFSGWQTFPFATTEILSANTTATATYYNLK